MKANETPETLANEGPADQEAVPPKAARPRKPANSVAQSRDRLVFMSMALVTAAIAAILYTHFAASMPAALLIAGAAWAGFMLIHRQIAKDSEIAELKGELTRLEHNMRAREARAVAQANLERSRPQPQMPAAVQPPAAEPQREPRYEPAPFQPSSSDPIAKALAAGAPQAEPRWQTGGGQAGMAHMSPVAPPPVQPDPMSALTVAADAPARSATPASHAPAGENAPAPSFDTALWPGTTLSPENPTRDQWAFRPRAAQAAPLPLDTLPATGPGPVLTIEQDLAIVQQKIKAMAEEVNATEALKMALAPEKPAAPPVNSLDHSIDMLKSAVSSMRGERRPPELTMPTAPKPAAPPPEALSSRPTPQLSTAPAQAPSPSPAPKSSDQLGFGELMIPASAERIVASMTAPAAPATRNEAPKPEHRPLNHELPMAAAGEVPPPPLPFPAFPELPFPDFSDLKFSSPGADTRAIADAIEAGRMDVFLSPIVGLEDHAVSHYEVNVRLKSAAGNSLELDDDSLKPESAAKYDIARLNSAAILTSRLESRGKAGTLLSPVCGSSISDAGFLENFARVYQERPVIATQLVPTLSEAAIEQFSAAEWEALDDMRSFGFRFALDRITHMETDFATLVARGFAFIKLDAGTLMNGLAAPDRLIPANELCAALNTAGLTIIASGVNDAAVRARVTALGIALGQGPLFGSPRLVNVPSASAKGTAAA